MPVNKLAFAFLLCVTATVLDACGGRSPINETTDITVDYGCSDAGFTYPGDVSAWVPDVDQVCAVETRDYFELPYAIPYRWQCDTVLDNHPCAAPQSGCVPMAFAGNVTIYCTEAGDNCEPDAGDAIDVTSEGSLPFDWCCPTMCADPPTG